MSNLTAFTSRLLLNLLPPRFHRTQLHGRSSSCLVKPPGNGILPLERLRLSGQNQKRCLKGIFGIGCFPKYSLADRHHQTLVTFHQNRKRGLISGHELVQQ
jgi:hypothetical protein